MFLLLVCLGIPTVQDSEFTDLLRQLGDDEPSVRNRASERLLQNWGAWKAADLARLDLAAADKDPEVAARAREVMDRILIRRQLGAELVRALEGLDGILYRGTQGQKLAALRQVRRLNKEGSLKTEAVVGLEKFLKRGKTASDEELVEILTKEAETLDQLALPLLKSPRPKVRRVAVKRLGNGSPERLGKIAPFLKDEDPEVRAAALAVVRRARATEHAPRVAALLKDTWSPVRRSALETLGLWRRKEYAREFLPFLTDPDAGSRAIAVGALARTGAKEYADHIALLLDDPYRRTRAEAVLALGTLGAKDHVGKIGLLLADRSLEVRRNAVFSLGKLGGAPWGDKIATLLRDPDPWMRIAAAQALAQLGRKEHLPILLGMLRDPNSEIRAQAAWTFRYGGPSPESLRRLARLAAGLDSGVRSEAIRLLSGLGARDHAATVVGSLKDTSGYVRSEAARALGPLGGEGEIPALAGHLSDDSRRCRVFAALALGELGSRLGKNHRGRAARRLGPAKRAQDRLLVLASSVSLMRLGAVPPAGHARRTRDIASDSLAAAILGTDLLEALSQVYERDTYDRVRKKVELNSAVESWDDLMQLFTSAGLRLKIEEDVGFVRRTPAGVHVSPLDLLTWSMGRLSGTVEVVLRDRDVRVLGRRSAFREWEKRLGEGR